MVHVDETGRQAFRYETAELSFGMGWHGVCGKP